VPVSLSDPSAVQPTFTAPSTPGLLTFTLTITDSFGLADTDETVVAVSLPVLGILKSGPAVVEPGAPLTYTLVVSNTGAVAATSLVITDALPSGAAFLAASDGGVLVGGIVSWTVPTLGPQGRLTRTFAVTTTRPITNADYRVWCAEGVSAEGDVPVVTEVTRRVYLPLVLRNR